MPNVVDLAARRQQRAVESSMHPSLRWVAGSVFYIAHAKDGPDAACGATGDLTLAPPGVPLCVECFPIAERATPAKPGQVAT